MKYYTVKKADINSLSQEKRSELFSLSTEDSISTIRTSIDGILSIIKSDVNACEIVGISATEYTYAEIKILLETENWKSEFL